MDYIAKLFIGFIVFSFLGWCLEVAYGLVFSKRFINRGFLIGPLCPIYGVGCVLLYLLLGGLAKNPIILALASMVICSVLEYFASYIMERIFKTRWWDYSNKKFNINGRICLEMAVPFGLLGLGAVYIFVPALLKLLSNIPTLGIYIIASVLFILFSVDLLVSFKLILKFTSAIELIPKDMSEEITKFVKDTIEKQGKHVKRLLESFPDYKINFNFINKKREKKKK